MNSAVPAQESDPFSLLAKPIRKTILEKGFPAPTEPQVRAIPLILEGKNVLLVAPTGTGKTEAAFLPILSSLITLSEKLSGIKVLYITPLRALNRDLLERLEWWCKKLDIRLAVRHGDTEVRERGRQALVPPDILITTPETLQAILPGRIMRRHLKAVKWVIIDEVHELAGDKRGIQLTLALERLRLIAEREFQVIGLSATIGTPDRVAKFLVGKNRFCEIVKVPVSRFTQIEILYPEPVNEDYELSAKLYTYPEVAARLSIMRDFIDRHQSTLIFTNTRSESEILASRFRIWDTEFPIGVHHGSLSKPTRMAAERNLKDGRLKAIICTSSLELGIDIGLLELVIQYNSPRQVTRLLQRIGRSGHKVGGVAKGVIITQDSDDTLEAMVLARKALVEELEPVEICMKPYDVLAHQLIGLLLQKNRWYLNEALDVLRRAYPYSDLSEEELLQVLKYLNERYPRLVWISLQDKFFAKPQIIKAFYNYYFENLSMIPDERQFFVLDEEKSPIGVLDEVFVAEYGEIGAKFIVGGRVWKILQIYQDKVYVKPEEDPTGAIPSWVGEEIPVPYDVALEVGKIRRIFEEKMMQGADFESVVDELSERYPASKDVITHTFLEIREQFARGLPLPTDRRITLERWGEHVIIQCCFGHLINRTLSRILGYLLSEKYGSTIGVQQDPYRIILKTEQATLQDIETMLNDLANKNLRDLVLQAIVKTGMFKRRFLHVAKKFGAISREADLSSVNLAGLIEGFKGTPIFEEAVKITLQLDADVEQTEYVLKKIASGDIELTLIRDAELTPIARIAIEELNWKSDLVSADRMKHIIIESTRARLLNEARTVVCTNCWDYVENLIIKDLPKDLNCPECGSSKIGILNESEEKVRRLCEKLRVNKGQLPRGLTQIHNDLMGSVELLSKYNLPAAVVLAGKGLRMSDASGILKVESSITDELMQLILEAEHKALKRRFIV